jgi:hypothetical protein
MVTLGFPLPCGGFGFQPLCHILAEELFDPSP